MKAIGSKVLAGEYAFVGYDEDGNKELALLSEDSDVGRRRRDGSGQPSRGQLRRDDRHERKAERQFQQAAALNNSNTPMLIPQKPNVSQIKIFAHGVLAVGAGAALNFNVQSLVPFRPTRGIMSASVSLNDVELTDIKVANRSQIASSSVFPGQMFSPQAQEVYIDLDVISAAIPFQVLGTTVSAQRCVLGWYGNLFEVADL